MKVGTGGKPVWRAGIKGKFSSPFGVLIYFLFNHANLFPNLKVIKQKHEVFQTSI